MSYDIYFIHKQELNHENIEEILEGEVTEEDDYFIPREMMIDLERIFKEKGLQFEITADRDEEKIELTFPAFQISIFNSQVAISLPYWDENTEETADRDINIVISTLLEKEFTGYDPQREEFITATYNLQNSVSEAKSVVDNHPRLINKKVRIKYLLLAIAFGAMAIAGLIWRITKWFNI